MSVTDTDESPGSLFHSDEWKLDLSAAIFNRYGAMKDSLQSFYTLSLTNT